MNVSFVRIFDKKADAVTALGFMESTYGSHTHILKPQEQVQVWNQTGGKSDVAVYGAPDPEQMWLLVSIAP